MRKSMMFAAVLMAIGALVLTGAMPAGAVNAGAAAATLSPNLSMGFPMGQNCDTGVAGEFDAVRRGLNNASYNYQRDFNDGNGCVDLDGWAYTGGVNHGVAVGVINNTTPVTVVGNFSADYTYSEPCNSQLGEAMGNLHIAGGGHSVDANKFWWSRVGLTALVILRDVSLDGVGSGTGYAAAIFNITDAATAENIANCVGTPPLNGEILIESPSISFSL